MSEPETQVRRHLRVLRRQWWLIVLLPALAIGAALVVISQQESIYRASMKIVVSQTGGDVAPEFGDSSLMQTMSSLLESEVVAAQVINRHSLDTSPQEFLKTLHSSLRPDSAVLEISVDWPERDQAVPLLSTVAVVYRQLVDSRLGIRSRSSSALEQSSRLPVVSTTTFEPPHLQPDRVSPNTVKTLGFAGALGLALGLLLAFARDGLDERVRNRRQAAEWFGAPVLGALPKGIRGKRPPGVENGSKDLSLVDAVQMLRVNLEFSKAGITGPAVVVTSAVEEEGKTTVAANLAVALASTGKRVVCIDADLRRPQLHNYLGLDAGVGLTDVLDGRIDVQRALRTVKLASPSLNGNRVASSHEPAARDHDVAPSNNAQPKVEGALRVLTTGANRQTSSITPDAVAALVEELRSGVDYIIFDSPPLLMLADSVPLTLSSDSVLVVAREGRTTKQRAESVRSTLEGLGVKEFGVIVTDSASRESYYGYA